MSAMSLPGTFYPCLLSLINQTTNLSSSPLYSATSSMVKLFQDILWSICFLVSGDFLLPETEHEKSDHIHSWSSAFWYKNVAIPLICLFPLWLRFNQCLRRYLDTGKRVPNLPNALKYAMSQSVTLFGAFHPLYLMHSGRDEQTISMTDDSTSYDSDIVIGRYRSNFFQVRRRSFLSYLVMSRISSHCFLLSLVFLDGAVHHHITLQFLLGCVYGLGARQTRVWILRTKADVSKEVLLLSRDCS